MMQTPLWGQQTKNLQEQIKLILQFDTEIDFIDEEGIWCSIIDEDSTYFLQIGNLPLDSITSMNIGSLTKVVTYDLVQSTLDKNNISIKSSVTDFIDLSEAYRDISIEDLLNHTSGLPKKPYFFGRYNSEPLNPYKNFTKKDLIQNLVKHQSMYKSSSKFLYSHLNYAILELILEKINKESFSEIILHSEYRSYLNLDPVDSTLIIGHNKVDQAMLRWEFPSFAASEGIFANIYDYTNLVRRYLTLYQPNEIQNKLNKDLTFAAPWFIFREKKNQDIIVMTGNGSGHSVFVGFVPESKKAIVLFRNSAKSPQNLGFYILNMITKNRTSQVVK